MSPLFMPGAVHLGKTVPLASSAANTPVVVFGKGFIKLWVYHYVAGYSGSSVALIRFGTGSTPDTAANYTSSAFHLTTTAASVGITARTTATTGFNGIPVANDATANGRRGLHEVWNVPGEPTMCDARTNTFSTQNPTTSTATQSSFSMVAGHWWPTTEAECVVMNAGGSGINLIAGTYIDVWGVPTGS